MTRTNEAQDRRDYAASGGESLGRVNERRHTHIHTLSTCDVVIIIVLWMYSMWTTYDQTYNINTRTHMTAATCRFIFSVE